MYRWILNELPLVSLTHQNILKLFFSIIKINIYFPKLLPFWMDNVIKVVENRWIWEKTAVSFLDSSPSRWNPRGIVRFHGMKGISLNDEMARIESPSWRKLGPFARREWRKKARKLRVSWASKIPLMRTDGKDFCHLYRPSRVSMSLTTLWFPLLTL